MNFSIQNTPRVATMKSNGLFGWKMDLAEPKAAVQKIDRGMYDYPFDEQEHHRTGESTYFDDWLCYIILKDNDHVRICTLKLYKREWRLFAIEIF